MKEIMTTNRWMLPWHRQCLDAFQVAYPDATSPETRQAVEGLEALHHTLSELGVIPVGVRIDRWGYPVAESGDPPLRFRWIMHHRKPPTEWWELSVDWLCPHCDQYIRSFWRSPNRPDLPTAAWVGKMLWDIQQHGDTWLAEHMEYCPKSYLQRVPEETRAIIDAIMVFVETVQQRKG